MRAHCEGCRLWPFSSQIRAFCFLLTAMTISGLFNTYFFFGFSSSLPFVEKSEISALSGFLSRPQSPQLKTRIANFLTKYVAVFFLLFCFVTTSLSEWVTEWVSEFLALLPRSSALAAHTEFERARARESKVAKQRKRVCVSVCGSTPAYTNTRTPAAHTYSHAHTICTQHSLCCCSALSRHPLKSSLALRSSSQSNLNNDTERFGVLSLSFSASKTFSLLKCPKAAATICKILLPAAAAAVVVAANAQWALRAAAATTKVYEKALKF